MNKSLEMQDQFPASPMGVPSSSTSFPRFHYEGPEELDIPEEGTMTIRYKQTREVSEHPVGKKHWYECDVTVLEICSVNGKKMAPARSGSEAGDALDKLASEYEENE